MLQEIHSSGPLYSKQAYKLVKQALKHSEHSELLGSDLRFDVRLDF